MWQWLVIAPTVAASAAYAAWRLAPGATRWRFAQWLSRRTAAGPAPLSALGQRLVQAAGPVPGSGADCDACPHSRVGNGGRQRPPRS